MTLEDVKKKVYSLIEEYSEDSDTLTEDEDLAAKMNFVINQIQTELTRFKKIPASTTMNVTDGQTIQAKSIDKNFYQLGLIRGVEYETINDNIIFHDDGTARIYYYKFPNRITDETEDSYVFELTDDLMEILPYGVAGDLLKSDVSSQYGQIYSNRYREMLNTLDPRYGTGQFEIAGGIGV